MAINIQNIIDQITTKAAAADSSMGTQYLLSLSKATLAMNNATGVIEYKVKSELPDVDSSILGNFAYIAARADLDSVYGDSYGGFYYAARIGSNDSGWDRIKTGVDSDAEASGGYSFQGTVSGYTSGGRDTAPAISNVIDKFPFTSDANATDVGDLTVAKQNLAGQSSTVSGYTAGGFTGARSNTIDKFPFSADANATDVGDLTEAKNSNSGQSSNASGYSSGGVGGTGPSTSNRNVIEKFPFSSDANATDVGDLTVARSQTAGQSSTISGYTSGGSWPPGVANFIDKFPFAVDANATDVGDLTVYRSSPAGQSSTENGYSSGGNPNKNVIDKFPFATDANATDVGDLTETKKNHSGQSSDASGYSSGGQIPSVTNVIDKFPFSSDANATDVGDLTVGRYGNQAGQQV